MDSHDLIIQLLPAVPLRVPHHGGQMEAFHLVHVVAHWLLTPVAAVLGIWIVCLGFSLAAWLTWGLVWMLRWPVRARRAAPVPQDAEDLVRPGRTY